MSLDIYPQITHDLAEHPSMDLGGDVDPICVQLHGAASSRKVDDKLVKILGPLSPNVRAKVSLRYQQMYGEALKDAVKGHGTYAKSLELVASPPDVAEAAMIREATKGAGTAEKRLFPLICGRSNAEIDILKKRYFKEYDEDLSQLIKSEVGGDFHKLLIRCLQGIEEAYDPEVHTEKKAREDAKIFYKAGQGRLMGTNEEKMFNIICQSPPQHLKKMNAEYAEEYGFTLFKALEKEMGGDAEDGALFTLGMKLKPAQTVAKLVESACKGMGTDEKLLTACVVRYQLIWKDVAVAYEELYGKTIEDRVKKETHGDYEKLLLAVMKAT